MMEIHEMHYQSIQSIKGLNNIFEEEYGSHSHLPWNEMCIYDLNWPAWFFYLEFAYLSNSHFIYLP